MRITVAYMRTVLKQFDKEEISFSKMVELLNEEFQEDGSFKLPDVIIQDSKRTLKIFIQDE